MDFTINDTEFTKNDKDILSRYFQERNLARSTKENYIACVRLFQRVVGKQLNEVFQIAEAEEERNTNWRNSSLRSYLIKYRKFLYKYYKKQTAKHYLTNVISLFTHFEITVNKLPYFSMKAVNESQPIYYNDLPDKKIIKQSISLAKPLMRAVILFLSSSGLSRIELLNLQVNDFIIATKNYHNKDDCNDALRDLFESDEAIIPTWKLKRQKTNKYFFTFSSPESTRAILDYLSTRKDLNNDSKLFKVSQRHLGILFQNLNDEMGLGKVGVYNRFRAHMLRKYHASQLYRAGMSQDKIDLIQGRTPSSVHQSYFKEDYSVLRKEYIECLPYLVLDKSEKIQSELDLEKEKNEKLEELNRSKDNQIKILDSRLDKLESVFDDVDFDKLKNLNRFIRE